MTGFRFVSSHEDLYPVDKLCENVSVSRSGYYAWAERGPSDRTVADAHLEDTIRTIHHRSRRTYGVPRVEGQLRKLGICVGRKRVARLMREAHLVGAHSRKKWRRGKVDVAPAGDLLNRDFSATTERGVGRRRHGVSGRRGQALPRRHPRPLWPRSRRLGDGRAQDRQSRHRRHGDGRRPAEPDRPAAAPLRQGLDLHGDVLHPAPR